MQNAALAALGLNWRYLAFETSPEDLPAGIAGAKAMGFIGLNLTVPHKLLALKLVDSLDKSAALWGAVNTIRFEGHAKGHPWRPLADFCDSPPQQVRSRGFNTDADALIRALTEDLEVELAGARVVLLGAGGAGSVAALRLAAQGVAELFLVNRTVARASKLAAQIKKAFPKVKAVAAYPGKTGARIDLLVNATSLGLKRGDKLPFDAARLDLGRVQAVYDMIYRPAETPLLAAAKKAGCRIANGLSMLLYQGARAFELWTEREAPLKIMRAALVKELHGN